MSIINLGKKPRSEMVKIAFLISKVCFDKFGGCYFLQFSKKV